jgi:hypothetical protein
VAADARDFPAETSIDPSTNEPAFYWCSRDSSEDGKLKDACDLWTTRPMRKRRGDGAYWHTLDVTPPDSLKMVGYVGRYTLEAIRAWTNTHTIPETDIELLVVGRSDWLT